MANAGVGCDVFGYERVYAAALDQAQASSSHETTQWHMAYQARRPRSVSSGRESMSKPKLDTVIAIVAVVWIVILLGLVYAS